MKTYTLQQKIQRIQDKCGWNQTQVSLKCGIAQGHISRIVKGVYKEENIKNGTANKINSLYNKLFKIK